LTALQGMDRTTIAWTGNQLSLIQQLSALGKKLIVVQFGGGQLDDSSLLSNANVSALLWAGYPGQDGGNAVADAIDGTYPPAGRLPVSQYPANYINQVNLWDPNLKPNTTTGSPGRTYMWYPGVILPFGYGLHYTNFSVRFGCSVPTSISIASLFARASAQEYPGTANFTTITMQVTNTGNRTSDYVATLYLSTKNAGPAPYPIKTLVAYQRAFKVAAGSPQTLSLPITMQSLARADANGNFYIYPGDYTISLDTNSQISFNFTLTGTATLLEASPVIPNNPVAVSYLGCYATSGAISGGPTSNLGTNNSPGTCATSCSAAGYTYSAVQGASCICGSTYAGAAGATFPDLDDQCTG
jgi:xylan 1,4-beta-xylosidase